MCSSDLADAAHAQGDKFYPLQLARELDDAILMLRTADLDIGTWVLKTRGPAAGILAMDVVLQAQGAHWLVVTTQVPLVIQIIKLDTSCYA